MSFMKSGSTEKNTEKRLSLSLAKVKNQKTVTAINEISPGRWLLARADTLLLISEEIMICLSLFYILFLKSHTVYPCLLAESYTGRIFFCKILMKTSLEFPGRYNSCPAHIECRLSR